MSPEEDRTRDAVDSEPKHYQLSYSGPLTPISTTSSSWSLVHLAQQAQRTRQQTTHCTDDPSTAVCLLVGCLTSQQQASVSQGRICSDNFTCCHTELEVADQTFYLTQSQYTDTGPTSPSADPIMPGAWQGSHWSANF